MNEIDLPTLPLEAAPSALPTPAVAGPVQRLLEHLVFRTLEPMRRGRLTLRMPDGRLRLFGADDGTGPRAEIQLHSAEFFRRCVLSGDIGFGESYQAGEWDTPDLVAVIGWFCANADVAPTLSGSQQRGTWAVNLGRFANRVRHRWRRNTPEGSRENIHAHYDLGNDFYRLWLDPTLTYSAALFEHPDQDLAAAQAAKYERLCRELRLGPDDHVLEIGSGWGGFAEHAVRRHGCRVTTLTLSTEQERLAADRFAAAGIADRARVRLQDYRSVTGRFDKVVSIEMLEAVGDEFLEAYFAKVQSVLRPGGLFAAQFITCPDNRYADLRRGVDWIQKHIFPGSLLLSLNRVGQAVQRTGGLTLCGLRDLGADYARTLALWRERFNERVDEVRALGFDTRFIRSWNYYLAYCEAAFGWRNISVVQATWAPHGLPLPSRPQP